MGSENLVLKHTSGSKVEVSSYGAQVLSWKTADGHERLFMGSAAKFMAGQAIRGGIPIVFPQFGSGILPTHGFARISQWQLQDQAIDQKGRVCAAFTLSPLKEYLSLWPFQFSCKVKYLLTESLQIEFEVENLDQQEFDFQILFHTYFKVSAISAVSIEGLQGLSYVDFLKNNSIDQDTQTEVVINQETDRVYQHVPQTLYLQDHSRQEKIQLQLNNLQDCVVWNPWIEKSSNLSQLAPEDYQRFVCIEAGNIQNKISLQPNQIFKCGQILSV